MGSPLDMTKRYKVHIFSVPEVQDAGNWDIWTGRKYNLWEDERLLPQNWNNWEGCILPWIVTGHFPPYYDHSSRNKLCNIANQRIQTAIERGWSIFWASKATGYKPYNGFWVIAAKEIT